jgi:hypothetical protein
VEQWNATCGLCRPRHERRTRIPLGRSKFCPGTPVRSSPSPSFEPSRQVTLAKPLRSRKPQTGSPPHICAHATADPTAFLCGKATASQGTAFLLKGDNKIPAPNRTRGRARNALQNKRALFLANKYYKVQSAHDRYKVQKPVTITRVVTLEALRRAATSAGRLGGASSSQAFFLHPLP